MDERATAEAYYDWVDRTSNLRSAILTDLVSATTATLTGGGGSDPGLRKYYANLFDGFHFDFNRDPAKGDTDPLAIELLEAIHARLSAIRKAFPDTGAGADRPLRRIGEFIDYCRNTAPTCSYRDQIC